MKKIFSLFVLPLLIFSPLANANKGDDIANTVNEAAKGYGGESSSIDLSIRSSKGKVKKRSFDMKLKEGSNGGYSLLTTFTAPLDLAKTKLLTIVSANGYDQWLRMGYLSKGKKIEANSSSKAFVDSDLSYEDIAGLTAANFNHKYVKDSQGGKIWILDQTPKGKSSYSKRSVYISKKYKYPVAIYFYSKDGTKTKTAEFKNFKSYKANGKTFWFPNTLSVKNHKSGSETTLQYTKRSLGAKFADSDFSSKL